MRTPLDQLRIKNPCPKSWHELPGNEGKRFCSACGLHVHNVSAMERNDVDMLVGESTGRVCVAYVPTHNGSPKLLDYQPISPSVKRNRQWLFGGSLIAVLFTIIQAISWGRKVQPPPPMVMGDIYIPSPQPTTPPGK